MGLIVRSSAIHAAGCYTTTPVRKGERVAEYTGRHISKDEADKLYVDSPVTYLFGLGEGDIVIDGFCTAMFINHSCDGNCETREDDDGRVWVIALRDIRAETEITYDYCLYDGGDDPCTCYCGASNCRGSMYSTGEIRRRKAEARKAAKKRGKRKAVKTRTQR
ncbi:SET domain-containing protein [Acidicapsa dinghuensis]|uniref:SET domain-containing protein n=1 Tax=Acidicapsa dinghuensis TaxID=2218256 RepID=A0ABW1EM88_9BACT|nr:SET domain-containing protein-lysine N-methyltransferase [Acidicapsa dinghuensis]